MDRELRDSQYHLPARRTFSIAPNSPTITATSTSTGLPTGYQYIYNYNICVTGTAQGSEQTTVSENGSFILSLAGQQASTTVAFSIFGGWVDQYPPCFGALIPGTMTGPMFTNGAWEFMTGAYIFTDPVGQANSNADYWFGGTCIQSPTSAYTYQYPDGSTRRLSPPLKETRPSASGNPLSSRQGIPLANSGQRLMARAAGRVRNVCGNTSSPSPPS